MIAVQRRLLIAGALIGPALIGLVLGAASALAQEHGRMRLEGGLGQGLLSDPRSLFAAPLPPGPAASNQAVPRAVNAYAPEQHVRLKQMNFTGAQ